MNKKYLGPVVPMLAAVAGLAAMGLVFCWCCPDRLRDVGGVASHWCFKHQIVWSIVGVCAALLAVTAGWKRLLKAAPFLSTGWVSLWMLACSQPAVEGSCAFVRIGPITLSVCALFPVALALLAAWLRERYLVGARKFVCGVFAGVILAVVLSVASSPDRIARINSILAGEPRTELSESGRASGFVQQQTRAAFAQARWFSACENEILRSLPGTMSYSMPASSAVVFGKWFMALAWTLVSALVFALVWFWRETRDAAKRMFIVFAGLGFVVPFALGHCGCLGLAPMLFTVVPLVSYDAAALLASWFGAGVLLAIHAESTQPAVKH